MPYPAFNMRRKSAAPVLWGSVQPWGRALPGQGGRGLGWGPCCMQWHAWAAQHLWVALGVCGLRPVVWVLQVIGWHIVPVDQPVGNVCGQGSCSFVLWWAAGAVWHGQGEAQCDSQGAPGQHGGGYAGAPCRCCRMRDGWALMGSSKPYARNGMVMPSLRPSWSI